MTKNSNILEHVEKYKHKYGISYADEKGSLVKTLFIISSVVWIYSFFMTVLFLLSTFLKIKIGIASFNYIASSFVTVCICACIMIIGAILYLCRQKIVGCAVVCAVQPLVILAFSHITRNSAGEINLSFYWRHAVPAVILFCLTLWIMIVLIRAKIKTDKLYNMLLDGLYKQYGQKDGEKLTEEQWQDFLEGYNPYKPMF